MRTSPAEIELLLIRHAETDWNRVQRLQGWIDTPLNRRGRRQACEIARCCATPRRTLAHVVCSPLARARQTAAAIADAAGVPWTVDPLLMEIDHGIWSGQTLRQIARAFPAAVVNGQLHPDALECGGGESLAAAYSRASRALSHVMRTATPVSRLPWARSAPSARSHTRPPLRSRIVVVGHGVTNALLLCAAVGHPPEQIARYAQPNGHAHLLTFRRRTLADWTSRRLMAVGPTTLAHSNGRGGL